MKGLWNSVRTLQGWALQALSGVKDCVGILFGILWMANSEQPWDPLRLDSAGIVRVGGSLPGQFGHGLGLDTFAGLCGVGYSRTRWEYSGVMGKE